MEQAYVFNELDKNNCVGCEACVDICKLSANSMVLEKNGFYYPITDYDRCVSCSQCIRVCPQIHIYKCNNLQQNKKEIYAGYSKNINIVESSSSGGLFEVIAKAFLKKYTDGQICAVVWDKDYRGVHHIIGGYKELDKMKRSKYIQSRKGGIFKSVQQKLENGVPILFVGCPCETVALKSFLGKEYEKLYIIDFVCQGPTAPAVMASYADYLENKYHSKIDDINLRLPAGKEWIPQWCSIRFKNNRIYKRVFYETDLGIAVHYMQRNACFSCKYKGDNRCSDITLGDFHGVDKKASYYNQKGTSILSINTSKGKRIYNDILSDALLEPVEFELVNKYNPRLSSPRKKEQVDIKFTEEYINKGLRAAVKTTLPFKRKIKYYMPCWISNFINKGRLLLR